MKVILRQDLPKIGHQGEVKEVANGYARNYLIPRQMVWEANEKNLKLLENEKIKYNKQKEKDVQQAKELAEKIEKISFTIPVKIGESGKLFGSVTSINIAKILEENGYKIEKQDIIINEPLKEVGVYTIDIKVHPEVIAKAKVWVVEEK